MSPRDRAPLTKFSKKSDPNGWQMVRKKRVPKDVRRYCNLCKNHCASPPPMRGHHCEFKNCPCQKCEVVRARRLNMSRQIRIRRAQDKVLGLRGVLPDATSATLISPSMVAIRCEQPTAQVMEDIGMVDKKNTSVYLCQRCKNHGEIAYKKKHKSHCPYANCSCAYCVLNGGRPSSECQPNLEQHSRSPSMLSRSGESCNELPFTTPPVSTSPGQSESVDSGFASPPTLPTSVAIGGSAHQNDSVIQFVPQIIVHPPSSPEVAGSQLPYEPNSELLRHWQTGKHHNSFTVLDEVLASTLSTMHLDVAGHSPLLDSTLWQLLSNPQISTPATDNAGTVSYNSLYDQLKTQFALRLLREHHQAGLEVYKM